MRRIAIRLEYDGTDLLGWQLQTHGRTGQGMLEDAVRRATGARQRVPVLGASRTDSGVHALGQVAHFDSASHLAPDVLLRALNYWLPADVAVLRAQQAPEGFHARFSAVGKLYRYRVLRSPQRRPLRARHCLRPATPPDLAAMQACATQLLGMHDFAAFTSAGGNAASTTSRTILRSEWIEAGDELHFLIHGDGFTYNMVRALVGTMLEAGRGALSPARFSQILRSRDRAAAGPTAPPHGLALVEVYYPPEADPFAAD